MKFHYPKLTEINESVVDYVKIPIRKNRVIKVKITTLKNGGLKITKANTTGGK